MIEVLSPDEVRRVTENVLKEPEFQNSLNLWAVLFNGFRDFLARISAWAGQNPDAARTLIIILGGVLALLIAHIAYTIIREFTAMRKGSTSEALSSRPLQALEGIAENWSDAFQLAKDALEAGDLYRGLWITHRVLLSALDKMDVLRFAQWKTNRDYLRECRPDHSAVSTLVDVSDAYEQVIYAHHEINREQAKNLLARVELLVGEAGR
jgi:hypothetical protein